MLVIPPPSDLNIQSSISVRSGLAQPATKTEWYTNGEMITGSTGMLRKNQNDNSLKFIHLSKSISGVFQIFYRNGDLTTVRNMNIFVTAGPGK